MSHLREHDVVRVAQLIQSDRHHDGTAGVKRPPHVGDCGAIVHIPTGSNSEWCIVECVDKDGFTIWLADFAADGLELVQSA